MNSFITQGDWPVPMLMSHLWNGLAQGSVALLTVLGASRLFRRISPDTSSWLWRIAFLKVLIATVFIGSISLPVLKNPAPKPVSMSPTVAVSDTVTSAVSKSVVRQIDLLNAIMAQI